LAAGFRSPFTSDRGNCKVDQVQNPKARRNGPAEYAFAHLKYGLEVPEALANTISRVSKLGTADEPEGKDSEPDLSYVGY
jgi:hypothetical protein